MTTIGAHTAKIYGIDWSYERREEIVSCSLDMTIKIWDVLSSPSRNEGEHGCMCKATICTTYPVGGAKNLPFGHGLLSHYQRGDTSLEMWSHDEKIIPVHTFEGHDDVVKAFAWRRGGFGISHVLYAKYISVKQRRQATTTTS